MRNRFDQFGKQMVRAVLEDFCTIETDAEVPAETRRIDLWFMRREARASLPEHLGLLGTIAGRAGTLELFHNTPSIDELVACLIKQGEFRHCLPRRTAAPPLPLPIQWIISAGRPGRGIEGLAFRPMTGWPSGVYEGPPLLWTRLVVVNELPVARSTLMLRLLGAGAVLQRAIAELTALPPDAPERMLVLPILQRTRLAMSNPQQRTPDDEEFLMVTEDIYETWRRQTVQEGVQQGLEQSLEREQKLLLRLLRQRFGDQVDGEIERRLAAASAEQIEVWHERVLSAGTLADLLAD
ncbi:MAG TPA: hypothetical protein VF516_07250 [Kofleriaceae bacterium]